MHVRAARVLLALYLLVVAVLAFTVVERSLTTETISAFRDWTGLRWSTSGRIVEPLANVAFFLPLALLACLSFPRLRKVTVLVACVLASVGIELVQAWFLPDRTPSLRDVAMNVVGAAVGVALARRPAPAP
jgi:VanZ family protein